MTGAAGVVLSLVVLGLTVVVGHSGATAVWGDKNAASAGAPAGPAVVRAAAPASARPAPSASTEPSCRVGSRPSSATSSPTPRPSTSGPAAFSLADVRKHASGTSCWAAIGGRVYDLTQWISAHPGGSNAILGICGTDATAAFNAQHGGQGNPARELATFTIGALH